ncbi:3-hydroxybenzoate 6-monooxygenase [Streptomyces sp. NPDC085540]|uniref:3-hydroxybenzoate 6-monooxygenase n=1 Tax=Streptomyces sp. NPDC085540 TaxID=3365730 RepID=UPI0037D77AFB
MRAIVAGGGIGGLAAALSVAKQGHPVTVLERRAEFTELGAGIQLAPNAFHMLDLLGVGDEVRERAVHVSELRCMDGTTGERVASMPLTDAYRHRFGNPYSVVHRIDLYQPLLDACRRDGRIELRTSSAVVGYRQDASGVTVTLDSGEEVTGAALIGADGIRSAVRQQVIGDGEPVVSGQTIYRALLPMDRVPQELRWNAVVLWAGPGWNFVHYPIGRGTLLNLAATRDDGASQAVAGLPAEKAHVMAQFPQLHDSARRLLDLGEQWRSWVLCDREPQAGWTDGRVTLLGDAAHPMLQYATQGAAMALEDAVLVGALLDCGQDDVAQRLEKYNAERYERTARAQWVSRALVPQVFNPAGAEARQRNEMLASFTNDDFYDKVAWLHGLRDVTGGVAS